MRLAAAIWLLTAGVALAQPVPDPASPAGRERLRRSGGGEEAPKARPDLASNFDPFAPDDTPPPRPPPFDARRPSLSADSDPLAALMRNGPKGAAPPASPSPEPWMLPGTRRAPTLADPPPGSAPATRPSRPNAPAG